MGFSCACGAQYESADGLQIVGWQECGDGEVALLVNCRCRSTICAEYLTDACLCSHCRKPIVGTTDDVKVMSPGGAFHLACARKALSNEPPAFLVPSLIEMMHFGLAPEPKASGYVPTGAFVPHAAVAAAAEGGAL